MTNYTETIMEYLEKWIKLVIHRNFSLIIAWLVIDCNWWLVDCEFLVKIKLHQISIKIYLHHQITGLPRFCSVLVSVYVLLQYSETCCERPPPWTTESGHIRQVVFHQRYKCILEVSHIAVVSHNRFHCI